MQISTMPDVITRFYPRDRSPQKAFNALEEILGG
jgi:hypothetical protein